MVNGSMRSKEKETVIESTYWLEKTIERNRRKYDRTIDPNTNICDV